MEALLSYTQLTTLLYNAIQELLKRKLVRKEDLRKLEETLTNVVKLAHDTGLALEKYVDLLKSTTEASVHATELQNLLKLKPEGTILQEFRKLRETRMRRELRKDKIENIRPFREDYEQARQFYERAEEHLLQAESRFRKNAPCEDEMSYLNRELDELVVFVKRRVNEQMQPLIQAYNNLIEMKKAD